MRSDGMASRMRRGWVPSVVGTRGRYSVSCTSTSLLVYPPRPSQLSLVLCSSSEVDNLIVLAPASSSTRVMAGVESPVSLRVDAVVLQLQRT